MSTLTPELEARFQGLRRLIGNTPLLAVEYSLRGRKRRVFAKSENLNMTGSVKDRMALHVLYKAYRQGAIEPGAVIAEATSGNTGISFAAVGRALGHPVHIFMPDWMSQERMNLVRAFGAKLHPVSREEGGFLGSIRRSEELAAETRGAFLPRQFANEDNCEAHETSTGPEIHLQLAGQGVCPDAFVAGVGTGGTVMGVGRYLRAHHPDVRIHPLEPANSPTLSTGHKVGRHRIQGISDEFIPPIVKLDELDEVIAVDDGDAILMAQKLACQIGLGVGISSGANLLGAVTVQDRLGSDAVVVTVLCDSNKKYLSTDLMAEEPVKKDHLAPYVELLGFTACNRVCQMCDQAGERTGTAKG
ncbi:MAG: cysteine synthase family protein [Longimicrobiales bacterium]|nr:cysteine synthase family protein [Longimicrobiales bacterium]